MLPSSLEAGTEYDLGLYTIGQLPARVEYRSQPVPFCATLFP
jgi:hypothetical protein